MPLHSTKEKKGARSIHFNFVVQGRFRPVSSVSAVSIASRYGPILAKSAQFGANRSQVGANPKEKKKSLDVASTRRQPRWDASNSGAAPSQPRPYFLAMVWPNCRFSHLFHTLESPTHHVSIPPISHLCTSFPIFSCTLCIDFLLFHLNFSVNGTPIREFKNLESNGVPFPKN